MTRFEREGVKFLEEMPGISHVTAKETPRPGFASALIVATGSIYLIRSAVQKPFLERLRSEAAFLAGEAVPLTAGETQTFAKRAAERLEVRVTLIAEDGTVVGDSAKTAQTVLGPLTAAAFRSATRPILHRN